MNIQGANNRKGKEGMVLFAVLAILSGLAMICATMFMLTSTDIRISDNYRNSLAAFYNADAGVQYVKTQIEKGLALGTLSMSNNSETLNVSAPAGYSFKTVTTLNRMADNDTYEYTVTGTATNSEAMITVSFKRKPAMGVGVFGDKLIDMKAYGNVYSYNSDALAGLPTPADSTGEGDIGSNENVVTHVGTYVDGNLLLGTDQYGNPAVWADPGSGSTITGEGGVASPRVEPDPLGIDGGSLEVAFNAASTVNNNSSASPAIPGNNRISLGNSATMTLRSGNYYVSEMTLNNGATLNIIATNGPVNIYLYGAANFKNGSTVNITGKPTDVSIYSNTSDSIVMYHGSSFSGFIYAPFANVEVKNSGNFYGLVWAQEVDMKNSGDVYIDLQLLKKYLSNKVQLLSWKEER